MTDKNEINKQTIEEENQTPGHEESQGRDEVSAPTILENLPAASAVLYGNDPDFRKLLVHFQQAEWKQCLEKIDQLQSSYPQDTFLQTFKQELEVRIKIQETRNQTVTQENRLARLRFAFNALGLVLWAIMVGTGFLWAIESYTTYQTNLRLEREAALLTLQLETKYNDANIFLQAGKATDALRLYKEIEVTYPGYRDIEAKMDSANALIELEALYQQGVRAQQNGESEQALLVFKSVEELSPKYKDSQKRISQIEQEQQINSLIEAIKSAYAQENWLSVVELHTELKAIDPFIKQTELDEILFISYRQLIIQTAGRSNASLEEIELAEKYYRTALSLVPQSREFASEREELQDIAGNLLANKYFLYGMSLLETSNYSINGMRESIRLLNKASGISAGSPVIRAEIEKAQLFIDAYDSFVRQRWTTAIDGFEVLYRKDSEYANGMLKYLLFEAYLARGDDLLAFSDFENALLDYQEAEKYAWGSQNNDVYLFKAELRIAYALRRLWREDDAAEFYRFSFDHIGYQNLLTQPEQADLLETLNQARSNYQAGNRWDAIRLYEAALENEALLYQYVTIKVSRGDSLAQIAFEYGTTIENLRNANQLGESMTFISEQEIQVPVFTSPQE